MSLADTLTLYKDKGEHGKPACISHPWDTLSVSGVQPGTSLATRGLVLGGGVGGGVGRMVHCNSYSDDYYDCSYQQEAEEGGDKVSC